MRSPENRGDGFAEPVEPKDRLAESSNLRMALLQATKQLRVLEQALAEEKRNCLRLRNRLSQQTEAKAGLLRRGRRLSED